MRLPSNFKLKDLCLRNIAWNIIRHLKLLEAARKNGETLARYEFLKYHFSRDLMKALVHVYFETRSARGTELHQFLRSLLASGRQNRSLREDENETIKICVNLLFHEYTYDLNFTHGGRHNVATKLLPMVLQQCKNLKTMKLKYHLIIEDNWISTHTMPYWNTLVKVNFLYSFCRGETAMRLLHQCPNLGTFKASVTTDASVVLYSLCNNDSIENPDARVICNGDCCKVGKNIKCLVLVSREGFSTQSAACALRHLPSLEIFRDEQWDMLLPTHSPIPDAINFLRRDSLERGQPLITLNLRTLYFSPDIRVETIPEVLECCPHLKTFCLGVSIPKAKFFNSYSLGSLKAIHLRSVRESVVMSQEFQQFLSITGPQLETIFVSGKKEKIPLESLATQYDTTALEGQYEERGQCEEPLDLKCIANMLSQCKNLKNLFIDRVKVTCRQIEDNILDAANCPKDLRKICLIDVYFDDPEVSRFFTNLLSVSLKVQYLSVSHDLAHNILTSAIDRNSFRSLRGISLYGADLENISLEPLIREKSRRLSEIRLIECSNESIFRATHARDELDIYPFFYFQFRNIRFTHMFYCTCDE